MSSEIVKILDECLNKVVVIKIRDNSILQGNLKAFDPQMNIILTDAKDITENDAKSLDEIVLRGDNIIMVALPDK